LCEQAVEQALPGRALNIRPGLIVGPHDPTDRFTYWPHRVAQSGEVLAPRRPQRQVQIIEVRARTGGTLRISAQGRSGVYHASGAAYAVTMGRLLEVCREVSGSDARVTWVGEDFPAEKEVGPWLELPLWIPESDLDAVGFSDVNCGKAIGVGLTFHELAETV